ncbi:glyoxylate/hydroxypyruvate reductase A [Jannaschia sp. Os4]|uniref:2-hydroxyacid dehydrogenase n=1 Tax=Jannaschia sp. Os4 TaxID=2807617 RepID=UPI001939389D|nr:glyoxylate/hydroxypyruvate reductase A [Jannaschia sp. Os4]MBM2577362.1 glyoxylate/hydroxypyruvate reductase A [Jannaschia sp. Os4]
MTTVLFAGKPKDWEKGYDRHLPAALAAAGVEAEVALLWEPHDPAGIDWIVYAPNSELQDFAPYDRARAVLNLWAGVEAVEHNPTLRIPLCKMVEEGLTQGMVEWVTGHVLRHHLGMDAHIANPDRVWDDTAPPLAKDRPVAVLGMGTLGSACASMLAQLGFPVTGWSRAPKDVAGVRSVTGRDGLRDALSRAQVVVALVPHTAETEDLLDAETLGWLPRGAVIVNAARGPVIDDDALLAALDAGRVGHATLDVFRIEPLPEDHPFWAHPRVTVTPHVASATRVGTASRAVAENVARGLRGEALIGVVDR